MITLFATTLILARSQRCSSMDPAASHIISTRGTRVLRSPRMRVPQTCFWEQRMLPNCGTNAACVEAMPPGRCQSSNGTGRAKEEYQVRRSWLLTKTGGLPQQLAGRTFGNLPRNATQPRCKLLGTLDLVRVVWVLAWPGHASGPGLSLCQPVGRRHNHRHT